ncbi:hypothetical protein BJY52DRAFT_1212756 [Lactarius psammicola]|nr:hypothetical protein BJY52DRAFT_1212756 [Lactarius psammicola]
MSFKLFSPRSRLAISDNHPPARPDTITSASARQIGMRNDVAMGTVQTSLAALKEGGALAAYLDDAEHGDELREHGDLVPTPKERVEQLLEDHYLPARIDELLAHDMLVRARPFEQDRVRADLAQLHHDVLQVHVVDLFHCFSPRGRATQSRERRFSVHGWTREVVKRHTLGLEPMLCSDLGN